MFWFWYSIYSNLGNCRTILSCLCPCCICCAGLANFAVDLIKLPVKVIRWFIDQIPCWLMLLLFLLIFSPLIRSLKSILVFNLIFVWFLVYFCDVISFKFNVIHCIYYLFYDNWTKFKHWFLIPNAYSFGVCVTF